MKTQVLVPGVEKKAAKAYQKRRRRNTRKMRNAAEKGRYLVD
jgi:hypothetical protein